MINQRDLRKLLRTEYVNDAPGSITLLSVEDSFRIILKLYREKITDLGYYSNSLQGFKTQFSVAFEKELRVILREADEKYKELINGSCSLPAEVRLLGYKTKRDAPLSVRDVKITIPPGFYAEKIYRISREKLDTLSDALFFYYLSEKAAQLTGRLGLLTDGDSLRLLLEEASEIGLYLLSKKTGTPVELVRTFNRQGDHESGIFRHRDENLFNFDGLIYQSPRYFYFGFDLSRDYVSEDLKPFLFNL